MVTIFIFLKGRSTNNSKLQNVVAIIQICSELTYNLRQSDYNQGVLKEGG